MYIIYQGLWNQKGKRYKFKPQYLCRFSIKTCSTKWPDRPPRFSDLPPSLIIDVIAFFLLTQLHICLSICSSIRFHPINYILFLNMSYLTDSYIVFTLKMESVSKNTIPPCKRLLSQYLIKVPKITNSVIKITIFPHGGISKWIFLDHFSPSCLGQKWYFWIKIPFWG